VIAAKIEPTNGFIYEAHFWNEAEKKSISIKQINSDWLVDEVENVPLTDTQTYYAINNLKVRMAQIWDDTEKDELCADMPVLKLKKVVFAGFKRGNNE
jgi:CRISPR type III-associated protein (TIGR04423 family)